MSSLIVTTCPHCRAEMEAFRHTRWDTLDSRSDAGPEFCPQCGKPLNPERDFWQETVVSGEIRTEAINVSKFLGAAAVAGTIVWLAISFYTSGRSTHGVIALALLASFALTLAWLRLSRPRKEPPLVKFELLPDARVTTPEPPLWDTVLNDGVRAVVPPPREREAIKAPARIPAPTRQHSLHHSPDEIARQVAFAWLEPDVDHPIRRLLHILSDSSAQWPPMRSADADLRLGNPVAIGRDGTRAYATVREGGRGTLSLLQRNGIERVLRFELKRRKRRA